MQKPSTGLISNERQKIITFLFLSEEPEHVEFMFLNLGCVGAFERCEHRVDVRSPLCLNTSCVTKERSCCSRDRRAFVHLVGDNLVYCWISQPSLTTRQWREGGWYQIKYQPPDICPLDLFQLPSKCFMLDDDNEPAVISASVTSLFKLQQLDFAPKCCNSPITDFLHRPKSPMD